MGTKSKKKVTHWYDRPSRRMDAGDAFIPDVASSHEMLVDDDAEAFAEEFIVTATSAEDVGEEARDEIVAGDLTAFSVLPEADDDFPDAMFI